MASLCEDKTLPELMWSAGLSCAAMIRLLPYSTGWNGTYPGLMGLCLVCVLCLSGDRRKEKEAQDQDEENSFTASHLTLSNLLHVTKSNPSLCHGNQSDQRPSGTIPPPSPPYQPTLPPLYTQMDSQGSGPTRSQRIATGPWSATRVWSPIGPVPVLNSFDTKLYPIQQHLHGTLPVKAWMLEQSKGRGHLWCWEREGSFCPQISSWWMTQTCPIFSPPLISVAANIQCLLHDEPSHKNAHKQCFTGSGV